MNKKDVKAIIFEIVLNIISGIFTMLPGIALGVFCIFLITKGDGPIEKILVLPFGLCALAVILKGISLILEGINLIAYLYKIQKEDYCKIKILEKNSYKIIKTNNLSNKIYIIGFLIFWYGFLIFFDYLAFKSWNENGKQLFFFSLLFWAVGIYVIYKNFKKDK